MQKNLLKNLNPEQKKAVIHNKGPVLIIAGAGTGKTTVITKRLAYLIEKKQALPEEILALTFTDKAAGEMEERVDKLLPYGYHDLWISTFHGFAERILKQHGLDIGLSTDFKVLDQTSTWLLIRQNLDKFDLNYYKPLGNPVKFIHALINHFSRCKDQAIYPKNYLKYGDNLKTELTDLPEKNESERIKEVAKAYYTYQNLLLENSCLDFGDLINYTLQILQTRKNILNLYQNKFKYILIDEFQDTNFVQYELIKILSKSKNNIMAMADDDQAIYKFRGACFSNVMQFKKDYAKSKEITLIKNYRSNQKILDLAYNFIQLNNPNRLEHLAKINKKLKSMISNKKGIIRHLHFSTLDQEVQGVIRKIAEIYKKDKKSNFNDFAILVRSNESAKPFALGLERVNLPYQFMALRGLYSKPIIIDIISYFKLLDNYHESSAVYRILNLAFFKILDQDIAKITQHAKRKTESIYETLPAFAFRASTDKQNVQYVYGVSEQSKKQISFILDLIKKHSQLAREKNTSEIFTAFLNESGYLQYLTKNPDKNREPLKYINQFYKRIKDFEQSSLNPKLRNFMEQLNLEIESGEQGKLEFDPEQGPEMVRIMTIHAAKGLEFKYVFLVNMVDKRFPSIGKHEPIEIPKPLIKEIVPKGDVHLQEERRLCYVAMTRAKNGLFFTSALDYGGMRQKKLSRFLIEMGFNHNALSKKTRVAGAIHKSRIPIKRQSKPLHYLPNYFSFSQLSTFEKCPYQYKFAYILKIPIQGNAYFSFGRTMHNVLYEFVKKTCESENIKQQDLFGLSRKNKSRLVLSTDDLIQIYKTKWIDEWYATKDQKQKYYKLGKKIIKQFYKDFIKEKPEILKINNKPALELSFNLKIANTSLIGRIDRVDKNKNGLEIIDYKTGKFKKRLEPGDKEQLLTYQIALEEVFRLSPEKLTFYYLEDNKKISFLGNADNKNKLKQKIKAQIEKIKTSDFKAIPGWQCQFCDFRNICEFAGK